MSTVSEVLGTLDEARQLLDEQGLRPYTVTLRVRTWAGERVGDGAASVTNTPLTVANGGRPKVKLESDRDVVSSGNVFSKTRYRIGPLTPEYDGGGIDAATLDPAASATPREIFYVISGPGLPATGILCQKVSDDYSSPFGFYVIVETIGQAG